MNRILIISLLIAFLLISCNTPNARAKKNVELVTNYVEAVEQLDYDLMDNYLADDYMGYGPSTADSINKVNAIAQWKNNVDGLYQKIKYNKSRNIAVLIPDGENKGEWVSNWAQLEITYKDGGEPVTMWVNTVYRIENAKISKSYTFYNEADVLEQLGYIYINPNDFY